MRAQPFDFEPADAPNEVDLDGILAALRRNKRLIAGATLGAAAAALLFCSVVSPRYTAEARILIENQESYFNRAEPDPSRGSEAQQVLDAEAVNSQIQLLTSRDLARKVVQRLGLQNNSEFDPSSFGGALLRPLYLLGILRDPSQEALEDRVLTNFFDHLTVLSPSKTRVLQVEFSSRDPDLAAKVANTIADLYIEMQRQAKRQTAHQAVETLRPLVASLEARVAEADAKVEAFRSENGLFENGANTTLPTQQLGEIATKLAEARAAQSEAQAKANSLRDLVRQGRLGDAGDIASNELVRRIAAQRVATRAELATQSRTLLSAHPRIKELEAQLADIDAQLRTAVEKAARGLDNDARVASVRVANLTALMEEQKKQVGLSGAGETQLRELQRVDKVLKDQLIGESAKYQAALARDSAETAPPDARIISRALSPSQPVFPKKLPITIFSALAGLFFSAGGVVLREMTTARAAAPLRQAPPTPRDLAVPVAVARSEEPKEAIEPEWKTETDQQPMSSLVRLKQAFFAFAAPAVVLDAQETDSRPKETTTLGAAIVAARGDEPDASILETATASLPPTMPIEPKTAAAPTEAPEMLRTASGRAAASRGLIERIAGAARHGGAKVVVASADDSTPACAGLALARSLARNGRAILVQVGDGDAHLRDALEIAAGAAGEEPHPGLAQLLRGEASFAETIYRDEASRLHLVQAGGPIDVHAGDLGLVLDALQATYDFVLIAAGADAAARALAAESDLTLIFAEDRRAREFLYDDFEASGVHAIVLAGLDDMGEIVEIAA